MRGCNGAAIVQLVGTGLADSMITSNPSITFWRHMHMQYTNFALETSELNFTAGAASFGQCPKVNLDRVGDLAYWMYFVADLPGIGLPFPAPSVGAATQILSNDQAEAGGRLVEPFWSPAIGHALIEEAAIFIGGQCIDQLWSEYMYIWEELSGQPGKRLVEMTGSYRTTLALQIASRQPRRLYVPLPFWFTQNSGLALPIVSLQFHSISVSLQLRRLRDLLCLTWDAQNSSLAGTMRTGALADASFVYTIDDIQERAAFRGANATAVQGVGDLRALTNNSLQMGHIECCYVYLDQNERSQFANGAFEQLIQEHQEQRITQPQTGLAAGTSAYGNNVTLCLDLNFNHPVSELLWVVRKQSNEGANAGANGPASPDFNQWFNFGGTLDTVTGVPIDPVINAKLQLNSTSRFDTEGRYFRLVQPYQHHTNIPVEHIYSYSFALQPEDASQPSGSANFSRIDKVQLELVIDGRQYVASASAAGLNNAPGAANPAENNQVTVIVYGLNWNTVRYKFGLGGKKFSH